MGRALHPTQCPQIALVMEEKRVKIVLVISHKIKGQNYRMVNLGGVHNSRASLVAQW